MKIFQSFLLSRATKMGQQVKVPAAKQDSMGSVSMTHVVEGKDRLSLSSVLYLWARAHEPMHTVTHSTTECVTASGPKNLFGLLLYSFICLNETPIK